MAACSVIATSALGAGTSVTLGTYWLAILAPQLLAAYVGALAAARPGHLHTVATPRRSSVSVGASASAAGSREARVSTLRVGQLRCALYELPLQAGEVRAPPRRADPASSGFSGTRPSGGRWHWSAGIPGGRARWRFVAGRDIAAAQEWRRGGDRAVEAGAALGAPQCDLSASVQYLVRSLDLEAWREPVTLPYIAVALSEQNQSTHRERADGAHACGSIA